MRIEIDHDGYPTDPSIDALKGCDDPKEALDAVAEYLTDCGYGRATVEGGVYEFATGGWSGCEEVIYSISPLVRALTWESSHRGGLHIFRRADAPLRVEDPLDGLPRVSTPEEALKVMGAGQPLVKMREIK